MIGVIDAEREAVKWVLRGMFVQQHDPDFLDNGHIMVFDNWGARPDHTASQILEIDPVTQEVVWRHRGSAESGFFSKIRGKQQALPNGNVLITEAQSGRVLEVTREESPEIVWEYHNAMAPIDGEGRVGLITLAQRFEPEAMEFLN
jgi:Arylsulfotransferase (ASST)